MIPAGLVNALIAWAKDSSDGFESPARIAALKAERDALVTPILNSGKDRRSLQTGSVNSKTFTVLISLSVEEKLSVLNQVLVALCEADRGLPSASYATFNFLCR